MSWYWDREDRSDAPSNATTTEAAGGNPHVVLVFAIADRSTTMALAVCRTEGWPADIAPSGEATVSVPEMRAAGLLRQLVRRSLGPSRISIRAADLLPAQIEGIRRAVGPGTIIDVIG